MLLNQFKQRKSFLHAALALTLTSASGFVNAEPIIELEQPDFGLSTVLIDFQSLTPGEIVSGSLVTNNVTFDSFGGGHNWSVSNIEDSGVISLVSSPTGSFSAPYSSSIKVSFNAPVSSFAFEVRLNDPDWKIKAYNSSNTLIAEHLVKNLGAPRWYGLNVPGVSYFIFENTNERSLRPDGFNPLLHDYIELDNFVFLYVPVPLAADTLASFRPNAAALRNAFNLQSAKMAQGLSYDCSVFDAKNICVSFAGTRSDGKGGLDDTRGALIVAHKPNANVRFGGYIDQAFNSSESGGLKVKHSSPGYGVFAVWSEKADGSGLQVRGSASFGKADMESTRSEVGTAEAGFGKSDIKSDGFQIEASRDYAVNAMWSARPYVGFRQLTNRRASYTETDAVVFPLSYSSIKQSTQSLLAGVRFAHTISAQTTMMVAAGLEHDIRNDVDRYEASEDSIGAIDSIDMEDGKKNTRPTLSLGLTHVIDKAQRIGVSITYRKEAFESGSTTSGMVQYSRGF
jgi:hypothetical protein